MSPPLGQFRPGKQVHLETSRLILESFARRIGNSYINGGSRRRFRELSWIFSSRETQLVSFIVLGLRPRVALRADQCRRGRR